MTPYFLKTTSKFHMFPHGVSQAPRPAVPCHNRTSACSRPSFEVGHGLYSGVLMFEHFVKGEHRRKCRKHEHSRMVYMMQLFIYLWLGWVFLEAHRLSSWGSEAHLALRMWDPSSLTRAWTRVPCMGGRSLNHWTTREAPSLLPL